MGPIWIIVETRNRRWDFLIIINMDHHPWAKNDQMVWTVPSMFLELKITWRGEMMVFTADAKEIYGCFQLKWLRQRETERIVLYSREQEEETAIVYSELMKFASESRFVLFSPILAFSLFCSIIKFSEKVEKCQKQLGTLWLNSKRWCLWEWGTGHSYFY